jgi:SAM-dependent methyltransferase
VANPPRGRTDDFENALVSRALIPARRGGVEWLDEPRIDPEDRTRAHRDIERANVIFGGRRAVVLAMRPCLAEYTAAFDLHAPVDPRLPASDSPLATLLDVGTGLGDLPWRIREVARRRRVRLATFGVDRSISLLAAARHRLNFAICADAPGLPFADRSIDFVLCSQLLHHFDHERALALIAELHRIARRRVIISDLRRSWFAAAGFWLASLALRFHPITHHDGTVSVLRGFTEGELGGMIVAATGVQPAIRRRLGYRLTASWAPVTLSA